MPGAGCSGSQRFRCFILAHTIFPKRQKAAQMVEFLNLPGKPFSNHFRLALDILGYCSAFHWSDHGWLRRTAWIRHEIPPPTVETSWALGTVPSSPTSTRFYAPCSPGQYTLRPLPTATSDLWRDSEQRFFVEALCEVLGWVHVLPKELVARRNIKSG